MTLPVYRLEPVDPTDSVWEGSRMKEAILTDAPDEEMARGRVAALALAGMRRSSTRRPAPHSLWLFSSTVTCILAIDHPGALACGVLAADGAQC